MTTFTSIQAIVAFTKNTVDLQKVACATLGQDKSKGLSVLLEETLKAALSAAIYNNPSRLVTALAAVKSGKKTASAKHWLEATTALMRSLPINPSGDAKRITDESGFVASTNVAITAFNASWVAFEADRLQRAEARKEARSVMSEPPAPTPEPAPAVALVVDNEERTAFLNQISKLEGYALKLKEQNEKLERENRALKESNEKLTAELDALRPSPAPKRRAKKTPA